MKDEPRPNNAETGNEETGNEGASSGNASGAPPDVQALARDWITLWQSELAAIAADREVQEGWQAVLGHWAQLANSILNVAPSRERPHPGTSADPSSRPFVAPASEPVHHRAADPNDGFAAAQSGRSAQTRPGPHDPAAQRAGADDAARPQAAPAAPDPRDAEIERLGRDIAALEARLAGLERGRGGGHASRSRKRSG